MENYFEQVFITYLDYAKEQDQSIMNITNYDDLSRTAKFFEKLEKEVDVNKLIKWDPSLINIRVYEEKFNILNDIGLGYSEINKILIGNSQCFHLDNKLFQERVEYFIKNDHLVSLLKAPKMLNIDVSRFELPKIKMESTKLAKQTFLGYILFEDQKLKLDRSDSEIFKRNIRNIVKANMDSRVVRV